MKLAFYKAKDHLFDRLVAWWMGGPYSHVEIVLQEDEGQHFCFSASLRDGGVRFKWMYLHPDRWDIVDCPVGSNQAVYRWGREHDKAKYDILGLVGFILRRGTEDRKRYFCSEAVAEVLGFKHAWRYDPNALYDLITSKVWGDR